MKILFFDNSSLTPFENDFCLEPRTGAFISELLNLGNEISVYGQKVSDDNTVHTYKLLENGLKVKGLKRRKNKLFNYILLYINIVPFLIKTDFVYIFYPSAFKYVAFMCKIFGKKYGVYVRGSDNIDDFIAKKIYEYSYVTFTVTDYYTNKIKSITRKNNVFSIRPMTPYNENDIVLNRKYSNKTKYKLLFLGRLVYNKGILELLNAVKILKDKDYNLELNIVGDGEFIEKTIEIITELGLENNVFVRGTVYDLEEVKQYYKSADLYVLPTYYPEGFPRTLYESMIFGTPIITTFVSSIPAIMEDGFNCKEIKIKSVDSLVNKLSFAMDNYNVMGKLANNATKTVSDIFKFRRFSHAEHLNRFLKDSLNV